MPEHLSPPPAGLLTTARAPVPLRGVRVDAEISALCARVTVAQRYTNTEAVPIEAVYVFPLDEGAAVCGFEALIDGTLVVGEVMEREKAFETYDDAIGKGHGGFLLDEERPDVFQASVGNLLPGKEVLLKITYVTELTVTKGAGLRFSVPTTVAPRYAPAEDMQGVGRPDAEALNPPTTWRVPYGLDLNITIDMPGEIARIESPSHPLTVAMKGSHATVSLSQRDASLDRDFVLSVETTGLEAPRVIAERGDDGTTTAAVCFLPKFEAVRTPSEIIFVIDRSGSMGGTSIAEVRNALQLCLRSLLPGCRFNIVGFGSTFQVLFPESRAYDERSLQEAAAHVSTMDADLGGTEILPALEAVFGRERVGSLPRQVVVLSDGEVTNTDAVLALARKYAASARIFTFGIGAGASQHLVKGLARAGGGTAEFIYPGERIEPKVMRQFARLLSPALTDVKVEWGGLTVTQAPSVLPPIWEAERFVVYAFVTSPAPATVRLTAMSPSGSVAFDVLFGPAEARVGRTIATLAARARIRELEESPAWVVGRGSLQRRAKPSDATREIIDLAVRYSLISRETSFVAIERRETPVIGDMQLRKVPIALTTGWGGLELMPLGIHAGTTALGGPRLADATQASLWMGSDEAAAPIAPLRARAWGRLGSAPAKPSASLGPTAGLYALVSLQGADGSWDLTKDFATAIGRDLKALKKALAGATGTTQDAARALATALALEWLRLYAGDEEDQWRMLAAKAEQWLNSAAATPASGTWAERAAALMKP